jgi:hypothetical protein
LAKLEDDLLKSVIELLPHLLQSIHFATATEFELFELYGETEETLPELEQIKNAIERARLFYNRLYVLVLQVAESQPEGNSATLEMLRQSIGQAKATVDAVQATAQETRLLWNLR